MHITNKAIRAHILSNPDNLSARIKRTGEILVRTNKQRGDGGPRPWTMFWGYRSDAVHDIKQNA